MPNEYFSILRSKEIILKSANMGSNQDQHKVKEKKQIVNLKNRHCKFEK